MFEYKKHRAWAENLSIVLQLGLTMAGCIVCCFFAGRYLDRWIGTRGVMTLLLTLFGVVGGGVVAYRQILEIFERDDDADTGPGHGGDPAP